MGPKLYNVEKSEMNWIVNVFFSLFVPLLLHGTEFACLYPDVDFLVVAHDDAFPWIRPNIGENDPFPTSSHIRSVAATPK